MDTETINGLHRCQPKNQPVEGQIKTFIVQYIPAKGGKKAWIKIKGESEEKGGSPYRVVSITPTGWEPDDYGNMSLNLEIEPAVNGQQGEQFQQQPANTAHRQQDQPPHRPANVAQAPPARQIDEEVVRYAKQAGSTHFTAAWSEAANAMALIPENDAKDLSVAEWLDLKLRIANGFSIEINKIIRKERF